VKADAGSTQPVYGGLVVVVVGGSVDVVGPGAALDEPSSLLRVRA
jgi:hypothetical protein